MRHETFLVACIPPVFVAFVLGFSMAIYAWDTFGTAQSVASAGVGWAGARAVARRYPPRDFLIVIWLTWAIALVFGLLAMGFPDRI